METKVDMSLDDIIAADRKSGQRGRGGMRGRGRGRGASRGQSGPPRRMNSYNGRDNGYNGRPSGDYNNRSNGYDARRALPVVSGPGKILISNLDYGVTEGDLYELFSEFGNIKMAIIHYDRNGMSLGSAEVAFDRKSDAIKGLKQYNGVPLDGKPMRIEITGSERELYQSAAPPASSYPPRRGGGVGQRRGGYNNDRRGGRGSFRGGRGSGPTKRPEPPKKEALDDEMDAYMKNKAS